MNNKIIFTLDELILRWLTLFPHDENKVDLKEMVIGGHVEIKSGEHSGKFISFGDYNLIKNIKETTENL